jgi:hypothetical protein
VHDEQEENYTVGNPLGKIFFGDTNQNKMN